MAVDAVPVAAIDAVPPVLHDLRPGSPDVAAFPRKAWIEATRRALAAAPGEAFGYPSPRGRPELHQALADYLSRARGVRVTPERIVICAGFAQGAALLSRTLRTRDATRMAMEAYRLGSHHDIVTAAGLAVRSLPLDAHGAVVSELGDADAVMLTAAHHSRSARHSRPHAGSAQSSGPSAPGA